MGEEDRRTPKPEDDPDKAVLVRGGDGAMRLVPGGNVVEGEVEEDDPANPSPSP
jgi:hypothetical protein